MRIALQALQALLAILTAMIHHNATGPLPAASAADGSRTARLERVIEANPPSTLPPAAPAISPQSSGLSTGSGTVHPEPGKDSFVNLAVDSEHGRTAGIVARWPLLAGRWPSL
jgi:hypothetical protein